MEIKTKYNEGDRVFFLTEESKYARNAFDTYLKTGEIFAIEATVMKINIKIAKKVTIINSLECDVTGEWIDVNEDFCAPDMVQLGLDVSNKYRVVTASDKKKKKR